MIELDQDETIDGLTLAEVMKQASRSAVGPIGWGAATSTGLVRSSNQDSWGNSGLHLFVVADGMGGLLGGELAAKTVVATITQAATSGPPDDWCRLMGSTNLAVRGAAARSGLRECGAAVVGCSYDRGVISLANVGDARAYRLRGTRLQRLTRDHTVGEELKAEGLDHLIPSCSPRELVSLTRYVGAEDDRAQPDVTSHAPLSGDRIVLCTDGVFRQLSPGEFISILANTDPSGAAHQLVAAVDQSGGSDNSTALLIDFG